MNTILLLLVLISSYDRSYLKQKIFINNYIVYEDVCNLSLDDFIYELGFRESTNRYYIVNTYGYLGRYQFSYRTLRNLGFKVSKKEFLQNELLQDQALIQLLLHNKQLLNKTIKEYDGKYVNGIRITESGILAAAHLLGPYRVKRYLKYGEIAQDGYGTTVTDYISHFSGYSLNLG
jgi:hypothetical protein